MAKTHDEVQGTDRGHSWHRRRGETSCEPCRLAWNAACDKWRKDARLRGWRRRDRPEPLEQRGPARCSKCGCEMATASASQPMCSRCRGLQPGRHIALRPSEREAIYERDGWTCQICLDPVDPAASRKRGRWGATLDHVVPRSHGGGDDPANLRLAHRWCNSVRGDLRYYTDADLQTA